MQVPGPRRYRHRGGIEKGNTKSFRVKSRTIKSRYNGRCRKCRRPIAVGDNIHYAPECGAYCETCGPPTDADSRYPLPAAANAGALHRDGDVERQNNVQAIIAVTVFAIAMGLALSRCWLYELLGAAYCGLSWMGNSGPSQRALHRVACGVLLGAAITGVSYQVATGGPFRYYPTARCSDGTLSYSEHHRGSCSWHGGVATWNPRVPWWQRM